jgi:general secretion pathway protein J
LRNSSAQKSGGFGPAHLRLHQSPIISRQSSIPSGFTLLELLISLTIVGVVLVIIFGALRIGARAWEKGEADVEVQQREKVVLALLKRQISSFCAREIEEGDREPYLFQGDDRSMSFMSRFPTVPTSRSGIAYVKYLVNSTGEGRSELSLYEQDVLSVVSNGVSEPSNESPFFVLIPDANYIGFEYLYPPEEGDLSTEWRDSWDPESEEGYPIAVRITFQRNKDVMPLRVIARIHPDKPKKGSR